MKIKISIVFLIVISAFAGCKQDFDVFSKYQQIPIVYGLLNIQDSTHYIRIHKGYQSKGNAYLAAGVLDSIYYPDNLKVQLVSGNSVVDLHRVTINFNPADPLAKDSGTFANQPNILYTVTQSLDASRQYTLQVLDTANNKIISSKSVGLVQDFIIGFPAYGSKITLSNSQPTQVNWVAAPNGNIYDLTVRFYYIEHNTVSNVNIDTFVDIALLRSFSPGSSDDPGNLKLNFTADNVFKTLANTLAIRNDVYRDFNIKKGMQFKFSVGGTDLQQYISSRQAQGGLTSGEALPPFTNITGGQGIFSSRYFKQVDSVLLSNNGLDSLACNDVTRALRFRNHSGIVCN